MKKAIVALGWLFVISFASLFAFGMITAADKAAHRKHYYLIGYSAAGEQTWSGCFFFFGPDEVTEREAKDWIRLNNDLKDTTANIVITGIYEFRDSLHMAKYRNK